MKQHITLIIIGAVIIAAIWFILNDSTNRITKQLDKYERARIDSLVQDLDRQRIERLVLQNKIDSLTNNIQVQKNELTKQIQKIKITYVQPIDYSKFTDSALVKRLLSDYPNR